MFLKNKNKNIAFIKINISNLLKHSIGISPLILNKKKEKKIKIINSFWKKIILNIPSLK